MAFTYLPETPRGRVRLLVADTDTADATKQIFTDAEIDAFLALESNEIYAAAAAACEALAASSARSAIVIKASQILEVDKEEVPKHYRELAERYRKRATAGAPTEEIDSMDYAISSWGQDHSEYVGDVF